MNILTFQNRLKKLVLIYRLSGFRGAKNLIWQFILRRGRLSEYNLEETKLLYKYIIEAGSKVVKTKVKSSQEVKKEEEKIINWILPDFLPGSGGHMTIFRIMNYLEKHKFKNNIFMFGPLRERNPLVIKYWIDRYFIPLKARVFTNLQQLNQGDAVIATSWPTAYVAYSVDSDIKKIYLVQDFEPSFYPHSSEYIFAENTYRLGLSHLCASKWLADKLKKDYQAKTAFFNLGYDNQYYFLPKKSGIRDEKTVIFYGRWVTPRRGFELGILALQRVYQRFPDVKIKIFGWDQKRADIPFPYEDLGILTPQELGELYRKATVGLSISLTNISLIPIEMMACGLPVVEINQPSIIQSFYHQKEILVSPPDPNLIADNLILALANESLRKNISRNSYHLIQKKYNWADSFIKIAQTINSCLDE